MIVAVASLRQLLASPKLAPEYGVGRIEIRLDIADAWREFLKNPSLLGVLIDQYEQPFVATCRRKEDGGQFEGHEDARLGVLRRAAEFTHLIDLEHGASLDVRPEQVIRSYHSLAGMPEDLDGLLNSMRRQGGAEFKIALTAQSLCDNLRVRDFLRSKHDVTAFCMGELGVPSRILACAWGSVSTYASIGSALAPGMPGLAELQSVFRVASLDEHTAVYGVTGEHVAHSLSPRLHNAALATSGLNAVYLPLAARDVTDFARFARTLPIKGASVTVPFKEEVVAQCVGLDSEARTLGAVNTITLDASGSLHGANTDAKGFALALAEEFGEIEPGCRILVLGAGGGARAVTHALLRAGAYVGVLARRHEQARALCGGKGAKALANVDPADGPWECVVNCTPCGMRGESLERLPVNWDELAKALHPKAVFYDLVYEPALTPLLAFAQAHGFRISNGLAMLKRQGEAQAAIWGYLPPRARFHDQVALDKPALVWLIGYRASGKSTLAPLIAKKLEQSVFDTDAMIEWRSGKAVAEIFRAGESAFRALEDVEISLLAARSLRGVVSTGGGVILNPRLIETMRSSGTVVYLDAPNEVLAARLRREGGSRPSLTGKDVADEVAEVMRVRRPLYEKAAHFRVAAGEGARPEALASEIVRHLQAR